MIQKIKNTFFSKISQSIIINKDFLSSLKESLYDKNIYKIHQNAKEVNDAFFKFHDDYYIKNSLNDKGETELHILPKRPDVDKILIAGIAKNPYTGLDDSLHRILNTSYLQQEEVEIKNIKEFKIKIGKQCFDLKKVYDDSRLICKPNKALDTMLVSITLGNGETLFEYIELEVSKIESDGVYISNKKQINKPVCIEIKVYYSHDYADIVDFRLDKNNKKIKDLLSMLRISTLNKKQKLIIRDIKSRVNLLTMQQPNSTSNETSIYVIKVLQMVRFIEEELDIDFEYNGDVFSYIENINLVYQILKHKKTQVKNLKCNLILNENYPKEKIPKVNENSVVDGLVISNNGQLEIFDKILNIEAYIQLPKVKIIHIENNLYQLTLRSAEIRFLKNTIISVE